MIKLKDLLDEDCWKGYKQYGMKKKGKKLVPNCVPVDEVNLNEIGEGTTTFPIKNKAECIRAAHDFVEEVKNTPIQSIDPNSNRGIIHAEFLADKQKYSLNYVFEASLDRKGDVYIDCIIGFAAKNLGEYPERTKQLAEFLYDNKYIVLPHNIASVSPDRKKVTVENCDVKYIDGTHTVEEISKIYLKNRKVATRPDVVDAMSMGDVDYALSLLDDDQAVELDLELVEACYRSTQNPSLIFITRKTRASSPMPITNAFVDFNAKDAYNNKLINNIIKNIRLDYKDKALTGGNKPLSILSTITSFGKELFEIIPTNELSFSPAARPGEEESSPEKTGRGRLYLAFVKKAFPTADVTINASTGWIQVKFKSVKPIN